MHACLACSAPCTTHRVVWQVHTVNPAVEELAVNDLRELAVHAGVKWARTASSGVSTLLLLLPRPITFTFTSELSMLLYFYI